MKDRLRDGVQVVAAPQLFPTPMELARRVVALAEIEEGQRVLEPSAGSGNLLKALSSFREVVAVEQNQALADRLSGLASLTVHCGDFLECNGDLGAFDRIVMNPPFAGGADIQHIEHAATMLKPGGRLVAVCANGPRQNERLCMFQDYRDRMGDEAAAVRANQNDTDAERRATEIATEATQSVEHRIAKTEVDGLLGLAVKLAVLWNNSIADTGDPNEGDALLVGSALDYLAKQTGIDPYVTYDRDCQPIRTAEIGGGS